jgi:ribonuclease HII
LARKKRGDPKVRGSSFSVGIRVMPGVSQRGKRCPRKVGYPHLQEERALIRCGYRRIAGLDEAGRGSWAGPVVAAAVVLPLERRNLQVKLSGARDSKLLTPHRREEVLEKVIEVALGIGIGVVPPRFIDEKGIVAATRLAMTQALDALPLRPDYLLVDYLSLPDESLPQKGIVRGDNLSLSIACASIVAKVERDRMMIELEAEYPGYGFARHKGYGTPQHREALARLGLTPLHRLSFAPMKYMVS